MTVARRLDDVILQAIQIMGQTGYRMQPQTSGSVRKKETEIEVANDQAFLNCVDVIRQHCPEDVLPIDTPREGRRWVISPVDGGVNYRHGLDTWATSLAVLEGEEVIASTVYQPANDIMYGFTDRQPASTFDTNRMTTFDILRTSAIDSFEDSLALVSPDANILGAPDIISELLEQIGNTRNFGCPSLELGWVANGQSELYITDRANETSWLPGAALVEAAGGKIFEHYNWSIAAGQAIADTIEGTFPDLVQKS